MAYTPFSLPFNFRFGSKFDLCVGHFETEGHNLGGDLRKRYTDESRGLLANVWDFVRNVTGHDHFDKHVVLANRRCWAAPHDEVGRGGGASSTLAQPYKE